MGYIRTNEDYYRSLGYSPEAARIEGALADAGIDTDEGVCNPIKLKNAEDQRQEMAEKIGNFIGDLG